MSVLRLIMDIYIREQLESTLCQLSTNDEVIVSDDSSTDYAINIVESLNDNRIVIFHNQVFHSPIFNSGNTVKSIRSLSD